MFAYLLFGMSALLTVGCAIAVAVTKNIMHSCIFLLGTLLGMAGLYATLGADFVAVTQIMVYVGGIVILMLFAIFFASVAPSISHALAAQNNTNRFAQEVCTSTGEKVVIQVITTKGKQLATEFVVSKSSPKTMPMHLEHCPFCGKKGKQIVKEY